MFDNDNRFSRFSHCPCDCDRKNDNHDKCRDDKKNDCHDKRDDHKDNRCCR